MIEILNFLVYIMTLGQIEELSLTMTTYEFTVTFLPFFFWIFVLKYFLKIGGKSL
jgi:hypothetical protein